MIEFGSGFWLPQASVVFGCVGLVSQTRYTPPAWSIVIAGQWP